MIYLDDKCTQLARLVDMFMCSELSAMIMAKDADSPNRLDKKKLSGNRQAEHEGVVCDVGLFNSIKKQLHSIDVLRFEVAWYRGLLMEPDLQAR